MDSMDKSSPLAFRLLLLGLGGAILWLFHPFLTAWLVAVALVIGLWPFYQWVQKGVRGRKKIAAVLTTIVVFLFLFIPVSFFVGMVADQTVALGKEVPNKVQEILPYVKSLTARFNIPVQWNELGPKIAEEGAAFLSKVTPKVFSRTTHFFLNFILVFVFLFFLFIEGPRLYKELILLLPLKRTYVEGLSKEFRQVVNASVYGYVLTAFFQSILATIGFTIVQVPMAAILGAMTFFASFIPVVGSTVIWVPTVIWLAWTQGWGPSLFLFFYCLILVSSTDNIVKMLVIRGKTNIHPLLIFLAILGGLKIMGLVGLLVGPIILALFLACLRFYRRDFIKA